MIPYPTTQIHDQHFNKKWQYLKYSSRKEKSPFGLINKKMVRKKENPDSLSLTITYPHKKIQKSLPLPTFFFQHRSIN